MVRVIGKTEQNGSHLFWTIGKQNFKTFGIPMLGIQAPTIHMNMWTHLKVNIRLNLFRLDAKLVAFNHCYRGYKYSLSVHQVLPEKIKIIKISRVLHILTRLWVLRTPNAVLDLLIPCNFVTFWCKNEAKRYKIKAFSQMIVVTKTLVLHPRKQAKIHIVKLKLFFFQQTHF